MPVLKNARHEAFAQALAKGMTATGAYSEAGYKGDRTAASRLSTNVNISRRVDQIKSRVAEKAEWTAAERLLALKSIFSMPLHQMTAVRPLLPLPRQTRMQGSYAPSKPELMGRGGGPVQIGDLSRLKGMTAEELDVLERALVQIGIAEGDQDGEGKEDRKWILSSSQVEGSADLF